ncbi:MAG: 4Fe-4S binding protein [Bacteriovoracaceae bacterium]|nr:4Fe-4S binding protein [Bacteriovoracaceae bacterium]
MSYAKGSIKRSTAEKIFIFLFLPLVLLMYFSYKYPHLLVSIGWIESVSSAYLLGKSPSFWYASLYTLIVCSIAGKVLLQGKSPYKKGKSPALSNYQKKKFLSIFLVQLILLYLIPFFIVPLSQGKSFFQDPILPTNVDAYVYISRAFTSWGGLFYMFVVIPLSVWFFGKRFCSWFCACGNLAETIGVTKWGANWVKYKTPTGPTADKMEKLQVFFMVFGLAYGLVLFADFLNLFTATTLLGAGKAFQDIVIDFIFGAIIGVGAYPFLGTRIWCRYGCPLAKMMELQGRYFGSKFKVQANDKCKGINLCSQVCPMGIDVASYAHKDKVPTLGSFGLKESPCIGCGGCIDICPVDGLEFTY